MRTQRLTFTATAFGAVALLMPLTAVAQDDPDPALEEEVEDVGEAAADLGSESLDVGRAVVDEAEATPITVTAGLGFESYMSVGMRNQVGNAFLWDIRASVPVWQRLSIEGAYVGSASGIEAQFVDDSANLVGTTFEAVAKWRFTDDPVLQPFVFGGLGWRNMTVVGTDFSTASEGVADTDNLLVLPVGAGVGWRSGDIYADARATVRFATGADLIRQSELGNERSDMHAYALTARAGLQF